MEYRFLVKSTKIENTTFPYKTALSEVNVKTNRMGSTKWTYHLSQMDLDNFVSVQEPRIKSSFGLPTTQMSIFIQSAGALCESAFSL